MNQEQLGPSIFQRPFLLSFLLTASGSQWNLFPPGVWKKNKFKRVPSSVDLCWHPSVLSVPINLWPGLNLVFPHLQKWGLYRELETPQYHQGPGGGSGGCVYKRWQSRSQTERLPHMPIVVSVLFKKTPPPDICIYGDKICHFCFPGTVVMWNEFFYSFYCCISTVACCIFI